MATGWAAGPRALRCLALLLLAGVAAPAAPGRPAPLLAWSSARGLWAAAAPAHEGRVTPGAELASYLEPALAGGPRPVLLFLREGLSVEDFTAHGGALPHLRGALRRAASALVLPAVERRAAGRLAAYLRGRLGAAAGARRRRGGPPALLLLRLPRAGPGPAAPAQALARGDRLIGRALRRLRAQGLPYTALLTAAPPPRGAPAPRPAAAGGRGRRLLAEAEAAPRPLAPVSFADPEPRILFWARNLTVAYGEEARDLTELTFGAAAPNLTGSRWNGSDAELALTYGGLFGPALTLRFVLSRRYYPVSARAWVTLERVEVLARDSRAVFRAPHVTAPDTHSFHCRRLSWGGPRDGLLRGAPDSPWHVALQGFQIQAFGLPGRNFSHASDCAGFFSAAIWMGLLVSAILLGTITFGLQMLFSLKTMDRFNDRWNAISVPHVE